MLLISMIISKQNIKRSLSCLLRFYVMIAEKNITVFIPYRTEKTFYLVVYNKLLLVEVNN